MSMCMSPEGQMVHTEACPHMAATKACQDDCRASGNTWQEGEMRKLMGADGQAECGKIGGTWEKVQPSSDDPAPVEDFVHVVLMALSQLAVGCV